MTQQQNDHELRQRRPIVQDTLALVLAGGNGTRLGALTRQHCKPALPFAGVFRNIDFTLSNCINSGIRRIAVLTQYKPDSLLQHLAQAWGFLRTAQAEFIDAWPAQLRGNDNKYLGTADAVGQNLDLVLEQAPKYTLILAGDHIYKMDYRELLAFHRQRGAQLTVGCIEVPLAQVQQFGIMETASSGQIRHFLEKPVHAAPMPGRDDVALGSMGVYVFNTEFLQSALQQDALNSSSQHDFGHDVLPWAIEHNQRAVYAYPFNDGASGGPGYWRDVGTIDAYWQAHMELLDDQPALNLFDPQWPLLPCPLQSLPACFSSGAGGMPGLAIESLVSGGGVINGATIDHSVLSTNVSVGFDSLVQDCVVFPGANIGARCRLIRAILTSDCDVPDDTIIGDNSTVNRQSFDLSNEGIAVVTAEGLRRYSANQRHVA